MATQVFICHAKSDIEPTSEIIDLLELALVLPAGALSSSSLPGYSSDTRSGVELRDMLAEASIVFALVTERSAADATFAFELGAAWALGARIVPLMMDSGEVWQLPWPVRGLLAVRVDERAAWAALVQDLAVHLGVSLRSVSQVGSAVAVVAARTSMPAPERVGSETSEILSIVPIAAQLAAAGQRPVLSCEHALEAGRAISDCVWNREEGLDFAHELEGPFARFIDSLGGSWEDLRKLQDLDLWLGATDNLLDGLSASHRVLSSWYELGYEVSTLHNLASQEEPATPEAAVEVERMWREALDRLLAHAEAAHISYEELGRLLALLENLMAPTAQRDFVNISRSLDELRRHATSADRLMSAA
jgi:hypothetical protein